MSNEISLRESVGFSDIVAKYSDSLDERQMRAAQMMAHGVSRKGAARAIGVSPSVIASWKAKSPFDDAVEEMKLAMDSYHEAMIRETASLSWDKFREILSKPLDVNNSTLTREQMKAASMIIDQLGLKKQESKVDHVHEFHLISDNVEEGTEEIIARRLYELQSSQDEDVITAQYRLEDVSLDVVCHPETSLGYFNIDEDGRYQCHVCGSWVLSIGVHSRSTHNKSVPEYKRIFRIPENASMGQIEVIEEDGEEQEKG